MKYIIILITCICFGQKKANNFYYLAIGSGIYNQNVIDSTSVPFENLPEANYSAEIMQKFFEKTLEAKGILYTSTEEHLVTKNIIFSLIDSLVDIIKKDKCKNPYIIFYYCGHGVSENLAWNQFLVPGNFIENSNRKDFDSLIQDLIYLGDINDYFIKKKYKYMVMIDCCRKENYDTSFSGDRMKMFFTQQNVETLKSVVGALKFMNEYHQSNPVVFSIKPGYYAPLVPFPNLSNFVLDFSNVTDIGPLCRRTLMIFDKFLQGNTTNLTVQGFINQIIKIELDAKSPQSICNFEDDTRKNSNIILAKN